MADRVIAAFQLSLPDGRLVFQRRTLDAPRLPGQLCFFGGHVEPGELSEVAAFRELTEETSLDQQALTFAKLDVYHTKEDGVHSEKIHLWQAVIPDANFEFYEGAGIEVYGRDEALARSDLVASVRQIFEQQIKQSQGANHVPTN